MTKPMSTLSLFALACLIALVACAPPSAPATRAPANVSATNAPAATPRVVVASTQTPLAGEQATQAPCVGSVTGTVTNETEHLSVNPGAGNAPSAEIDLTSAVGAIHQTLSTSSAYSFTSLPPGSYTLKETPPNGFVASGESITYVTITCGATATYNFVNVQGSGPNPTSNAETTAAPAQTGTPIALTADSPDLSWVVTNQPVSAMYVDSAGTLYYGAPATTAGIADPFTPDSALWKKPVDGAPIQLTPNSHNLIGGIVVYDGNIYFDEAGSLDRIPNDNRMHDPVDVVLRFVNLSHIYGHINSALAVYTYQNEPVLLISVGSQIDSYMGSVGHRSGIQPPYYEDFPTGRIIFAKLQWLETAHNYIVKQNGGGQVYEFARGVRNPWGMTVGELDGQTQIFAADNDPAFTPEKYDSDPQNAGDELNRIVFGVDYGHPFYYAGREPDPISRPIAVFLDGSVPSGVAIADGKLFVSLYQAEQIVQVDPNNPDRKHSWAPVLTGIGAFNLASHNNLLYMATWQGIQVIDASMLPVPPQ
jgi:hypothetical protein